jgi:hypothetical protein
MLAWSLLIHLQQELDMRSPGVTYTKVLFGLALTAFISMVVAVSLYVKTFGNTIAQSHEVWGQFGDFLGGTTNPVLAFMAFIGVLWTIGLTYKTMEMQRMEGLKNDCYKILTALHDTVMKKASEKTIDHSVVFNERLLSSKKYSISEITEMAQESIDWEAVSVTYRDELHEVSNHLVLYLKFLKHYSTLSDNSLVVEYYFLQFKPLLDTFHKAGFMDVTEQMDSFDRRSQWKMQN